MKQYYIQYDVGRRGNILVNYHNGHTYHADGSPFFDVCILRNRQALRRFINSLTAAGYVERSY